MDPASASGIVFKFVSCSTTPLIISSLLDASESLKRVMETMEKHPDLLSELSLTFFPAFVPTLTTFFRFRTFPPLPSHVSITTMRTGTRPLQVPHPPPPTRPRRRDHRFFRSRSRSLRLRKNILLQQTLPVKSLRGVYDSPLNKVWDTVVGPQIRDLVKQEGWSVLVHQPCSLRHPAA